MIPSPARPPAAQFLDDREVAQAVHSVLEAPPFVGPQRETSPWRLLAHWRTDGLLGAHVDRSAALITFAVAALLTLTAAALFSYLSLRRRSREAAASAGEHARNAAHYREAAVEALGLARFRLAVEWAWALAVFQLEGARGLALSPRQWARRTAPRLSATGVAQLARLLRLHELACYAGGWPAPAEAREAVSLALALTGAEDEAALQRQAGDAGSRERRRGPPRASAP